MRFLWVPDSFKGSMSAKRVCELGEKTIKECLDGAITYAYPAFDGGEGSVENLVDILEGTIISGKATDGNFEVKTATYGACADTAIIAVANTSGLPDTKRKDPAITTTYGLGEQIGDALKRGYKKIVIALGGSSTNDGGAGAAVALGVRFYKKDGESFVPTGGSLGEIDRVDDTALQKLLAEKRAAFIGLCDVNNPLLGKNGCSHVYGKQKGALTLQMRETLDENMRNFYEKTSYLGVSDTQSGNGAAGGLGYFVHAFLKGTLVSGADYFLDTIRFEEKASTCEYVLCGEGKFDKTSAQGKICGRIRDRAAKTGAKVVVFCGVTETERADGVVAIYPIADPERTLEENIKDAEVNFVKAVRCFCDDIQNGSI